MSDTETWKGTLTPTGLTLEEFMGNINEGSQRCDAEELRDAFESLFCDEKVLIHNMVYSVKRSRLEPDDIFEAIKNSDGSYTFLVQFYNGGMGFSEAIESAIKNQGEHDVNC